MNRDVDLYDAVRAAAPGPWGTDDDEPSLIYSDSGYYPGGVVAWCFDVATRDLILGLYNLATHLLIHAPYREPPWPPSPTLVHPRTPDELREALDGAVSGPWVASNDRRLLTGVHAGKTTLVARCRDRATRDLIGDLHRQATEMLTTFSTEEPP